MAPLSQKGQQLSLQEIEILLSLDRMYGSYHNAARTSALTPEPRIMFENLPANISTESGHLQPRAGPSDQISTDAAITLLAAFASTNILVPNVTLQPRRYSAPRPASSKTTIFPVRQRLDGWEWGPGAVFDGFIPNHHVVLRDPCRLIYSRYETSSTGRLVQGDR
jgi:hypothetical protein